MRPSRACRWTLWPDTLPLGAPPSSSPSHPLTAGLHTSLPSSAAAASAIRGGGRDHCPHRPLSRSPPFQPQASGSSTRTRDRQRRPGLWVLPVSPACAPGALSPESRCQRKVRTDAVAVSPQGRWKRKLGFLVWLPPPFLPSPAPEPKPAHPGGGGLPDPSSPFPKTLPPQRPAQGGPSSQRAQRRGGTTPPPVVIVSCPLPGAPSGAPSDSCS